MHVTMGRVDGKEISNRGFKKTSIKAEARQKFFTNIINRNSKRQKSSTGMYTTFQTARWSKGQI